VDPMSDWTDSIAFSITYAKPRAIRLSRLVRPRWNLEVANCDFKVGAGRPPPLATVADPWGNLWRIAAFQRAKGGLA